MPTKTVDPKPKSEKSGVRTAEVVYATSNSGVTPKAAVSLPAEPWDIQGTEEQ